MALGSPNFPSGCEGQLGVALEPTHLEPAFGTKRSHCKEKPMHHNEEQPLITASVSVTRSRGLLKLMSIESVMPSNHRTLVIPFSSAFNQDYERQIF